MERDIQEGDDEQESEDDDKKSPEATLGRPTISSSPCGSVLGHSHSPVPRIPDNVPGSMSLDVPCTGPYSNPVRPPGSNNVDPAGETPVGALRRYLDTMPQHPPPREELASRSVWRAVRSEVIASFLLTLITASAALQPPDYIIPPCSLHHTAAAAMPIPRTLPAGSNNPAGSLGGSGHHQESYGWGWAAGHGLTMAGLTWAIKTAHFSLPTTLALFVARKISAVRATLHVLAQIIGSLVAAPVLLGLLPRPPRTPTLGPDLSVIQGWGAEFLATLVVSLVSLSSYEIAVPSTRITNANKATSDDVTCPRTTTSSVIPLAAAHTSGALMTAGFTGIGLNPGRSLALASVTGAWKNHWVFWVGPALGGLLAAFTHEYTGHRHGTYAPSNAPLSNIPRETSRPSALTSALASP